MQLASNATLAESPIDILLWDFPLKAHFAILLKRPRRLSNLAPPRSRAARHATVDHQFRARHVAGCVRGEEENPVRALLRPPTSAERRSAFASLVRIYWRIASGGHW